MTPSEILLAAIRRAGPPKRLVSWNRAHQGARECARRRRQIERWPQMLHNPKQEA